MNTDLIDLSRPQQTYIRLILDRSSDWSCDWSCNITVMNTCSLMWADERQFLSSWVDLTASSIMLTSSMNSYPPLIFPRKQIMQSLMYVRWVPKPALSTQPVSHTNVVSNTASPEELAAVLQLPFIIAQQSIQIHDFYIKIHSSSFWDMHQDVLSHDVMLSTMRHYWNRMLINRTQAKSSSVIHMLVLQCHMYSCHVSPAMFVCPAIPAIVISTMRLTMALSLLSIDSSSCSNSCSNRFKLMLSIVPIEVHALTSVFRHQRRTNLPGSVTLSG